MVWLKWCVTLTLVKLSHQFYYRAAGMIHRHTRQPLISSHHQIITGPPEILTGSRSPLLMKCHGMLFCCKQDTENSLNGKIYGQEMEVVYVQTLQWATHVLPQLYLWKVIVVAVDKASVKWKIGNLINHYML